MNTDKKAQATAPFLWMQQDEKTANRGWDYPQISGHKSRFAIRFMPLDSENGLVPERLDFELACC